MMILKQTTMTPRANTYSSREDWLRARKDGIGASEVAGLLGVSKWTTPYALWAEKVTPEIDLDRPMSDRQRWGLALEDTIAEAFEEDTKLKTFLPTSLSDDLTATHLIVWHGGVVDGRACPLFATPDRFVEVPGSDYAALAELKTAGAERASDWADVPPVEYLVQVQAQLACCPSAPWAYIAVLIGGNDFRWYQVERDPETIAEIERIATAFWWERVASEVPPPVDGHPATTEAIKRMHPTGDDELAVELPSELVLATEELAELKAKQKDLDCRKTELENRIKAEMGDATIGLLGKYTWTWKEAQRKGSISIPDVTDAAKAALAQAGVAYKETPATSYRVLRVKTSKDQSDE